jgi:hypothetical protein
MGSGPGTNTGHGHVWERPDGVKARCGGPVICAECSRDYAEFNKAVAKDAEVEHAFSDGPTAETFAEPVLGNPHEAGSPAYIMYEQLTDARNQVEQSTHDLTILQKRVQAAQARLALWRARIPVYERALDKLLDPMGGTVRARLAEQNAQGDDGNCGVKVIINHGGRELHVCSPVKTTVDDLFAIAENISAPGKQWVLLANREPRPCPNGSHRMHVVFEEREKVI